MDAEARRGHLERIARDGYTLIEDVFDASHADALAGDLLRLEGELGIGTGNNPFEGSLTWRIYNLLVHGKLYEEIPIHPHVLPVVEGVLDEGCLLSSLSSISITPPTSRRPTRAFPPS